MSIVLDTKYASMISPFVRNFSKKNSVYNFSCPFCGDSKKIASKARGYLFPDKSGSKMMYKCWNCGMGGPMGKLLGEVDRNLEAEYKKDKFLEYKSDNPLPEQKMNFAPPKFKKHVDSDLIKVSTLDPSHIAKRYVMGRQIPSELHYKLFYIDDFKRWTNKIVPGTFDRIGKDEGRLVIPLINREHKIMGYQGRSFDPDHPLKYITTLVDPHAIKMYGLDSIDINRTIRAFEGPIDAMFIDNSVATTGGRQDTLLQQAGIGKDRTILVYDNEPRNKYTIEKMIKGLNAGWTVCIWPTAIKETDVNAMVLAGHRAQDLTTIIDNNAFSGLMGLAALQEWRKV